MTKYITLKMLEDAEVGGKKACAQQVEALKQYESVAIPAWETFRSVTNRALKKYEGIKASRNHAPEAWDERNRIVINAREEYERTCILESEARKRITEPAFAEYRRALAEAFARLYLEDHDGQEKRQG